MVEGVTAGVDAVFFVGYHAMVGRSDGVANETIIGREMVETRMNGEPIGEPGIDAALCGHHGAPVVLATGDDALEKDVRAVLPSNVEYAVTKHATDRWTARCLSPQRSREAIREGAARTLSNLDGFSPHRVEGPIAPEVEFTSTSEAYWRPSSRARSARDRAPYRPPPTTSSTPGRGSSPPPCSASDEVYG